MRKACIAFSVLTLLCIQFAFGATANPIVLTSPCPSGSRVGYMIEITEDLNGDGFYDHRSTRSCSGGWTIDCWPESCNGKTVWMQVDPSFYHTYSQQFNSALNIFTWRLEEFDDSTNMNLNGRLERIDDTTLIYTDLSPYILPVENFPNVITGRSDFSVLWTDEDQIQVTVKSQSAENISIEVYDIQGRVIGNANADAGFGEHTVLLSVANTFKGVFVVKFSQGNTILIHKLLH